MSRVWRRALVASPVLVPLFDWGNLNPLHWLGGAATEAVGQAWTSAMIAAWSSGLWVLGLAFKAVDAFTSPDLSANGPMGAIYPYTFGIGAMIGLLMAVVQIGVAAFKRDGASIARLMIGVVQFAAVWVGYVAVASALVLAASGLTHGLLEALLGIHGFAGYQPGAGWPRDVTDTATATVLGICAWLLIWPAAIAYLLIMMVREAALLVLAATSPIAAGGLMSEMGRTWFWRSLRWFFAALLISPLAALVLGVGEKISEGVVSGLGASAGTGTAEAVGMAVIGCLLVVVGAVCPIVLFRLLAFVEPGTSSGAAMRTALAAHGGVSGLLSRSGGGTGDAAAQGDGSGRSAGEASADTTTTSRFAAAGAALAGVGRVAQGSVGLAADVLGSSGVGHSHHYYRQYDQPRPVRRRSPGSTTEQSSDRDESEATDQPPPPDPGGSSPGSNPGPPPTAPPGPPTPAPPTGPPGGGAGGGTAGGAAAGESAAGAAGTAAL